MTQIIKEDLQKLFDIAVHCMDFGSGFLDDDEVKTLRRVAVVLGVDPADATPTNFAAKYPHAMKQGGSGPYCGRCWKPADDAIHAPSKTTGDLVLNPVSGESLGVVVSGETAGVNKIIEDRQRQKESDDHGS